jgi:hypothetical protein
MSFSKETAVEHAKRDLAQRLDIDENEIKEVGVTEREFPDMSLGAATPGEMSAQMISSGWQIDLAANDERYEYRADKYQLRLHNFNGANYVIES